MRAEKILLVDDEQNILDGFKRALRKEFQIDTTLSATEALAALQHNPNYAVIVSDMRMPDIDGVQFLKRAKVVSPASVRVMLTGNADQQTAIDAVNEGSIFRFLNKPCAPETMAKTLDAALEQYRLARAEKELLEKTLSATVQTLTDVLALTNPAAFGRATRVRHLVRQIANQLRMENGWQVELAAMLSQIGCITIPPEILQKVYGGAELSLEEYYLWQTHPQIGHDLIVNIPRLEAVAEMIAYQEKRWNGTGAPHDDRSGERIPLGARVLKVALDLDKLTEAKLNHLEALDEIESRAGWYDPAVIEAVRKTVHSDRKYEAHTISVDDLQPGMILAESVTTINDVVLLPGDQEVTAAVCLRIKHFAETGILPGTLKVLIAVGTV